MPVKVQQQGAVAVAVQVFRNKKIEHLVHVEVSTTMCNKCYCFIYDHIAKVLQHDDILKIYCREKNVKRILPELADEMERLIKKYPNCLYDASFIYSDFSYIAILLVENNFVKRFVGPNKIEIKKPMSKAKEWFGKKFLELTNCLPQIHSDHSGGINTESYKVINDMAAEERKLVEKSMNELRIRIPTIQICVKDEYDGLYS